MDLKNITAGLEVEPSNTDTNAVEQPSNDANQDDLQKSPDSSPGKTDESPNDRVQKRINKLTSQRNQVRDENTILQEKIQSLESKIDSFGNTKSVPEERPISRGEMVKAAQKFIDDNDADGLIDLIQYSSDAAVKEYDTKTQKAKEDETQKALSIQKNDQHTIQKIVDVYPEVRDQNSDLRKTADTIFQKSPELQGLRWQGYFVAVAQAKNILIEEGVLGNQTKKRQQDRDSVGESLLDGSSDLGGGEESSPSKSLDKYYENRRKINEKLTNVSLPPVQRR